MYLRRYCIVTRRNGAQAYDLYDTMNRQAYFRDNGRFRFDAASRNIEALHRIRGGETPAMDAVFFEPHFVGRGIDEPTEPMRMNTAAWWHQHGVRVPMDAFDNQEFEIQAVEAVDTIEVAHAIWNLNANDDGEVTTETEPETDTSNEVSLVADIGDFDVDEEAIDEVFNMDFDFDNDENAEPAV